MKLEKYLKNHDFLQVLQYPNEFIITFPKGYHGGFNTGFNINEATNFATKYWWDKFAKQAKVCKCKNQDDCKEEMKKRLINSINEMFVLNK